MLRSDLDGYLAQILTQAPGLSDIHLSVGRPVMAEEQGALRELELNPDPGPLVPWQVESMACALMGQDPRLYQDLIQTGSCDLSYQLRDRARFRVNVFMQKGSLAVVMRKLATSIPTLSSLGLPGIFSDMAGETFGLILVTGATGSGKSTSLAALVDAINASRPVHILTLEDPVEFVHPHQAGLINQRELGRDFDAFASGLRAALRQAPKVILVGEIRDRETMAIALEASETGHLVLGTLHTSDAAQTINRIIGMFELSEERLIRGRLAESLKYVVSQRLVPTTDGGRIAALEILKNTIRIRELILQGEDAENTFSAVLEQSGTYGMQTFDQHLVQLYSNGRIGREMAMLHGSDKSKLGQMIDRIRSERGEKVTDIEHLELDLEYEKRGL
ncbi:type IV pilus twitching motility protein PilT [Desulfovermiculus halophilus]|jgi:twitching motility protein PilT|uniref:type IV pilus twitching motility protein PilT n=1 Tax=Desulfovermiculus halophilus TaxID=339722 RepID=UPI0004817566|nr:PilT/PilU family type 4a pilus ATPase [Desulfovermiculus halophilus]